jgi:hypothetical protein
MRSGKSGPFFYIIEMKILTTPEILLQQTDEVKADAATIRPQRMSALNFPGRHVISKP